MLRDLGASMLAQKINSGRAGTGRDEAGRDGAGRGEAPRRGGGTLLWRGQASLGGGKHAASPALVHNMAQPSLLHGRTGPGPTKQLLAA